MTLQEVKTESVTKLINGTGDIPVSYTHLDVYKRQLHEFVLTIDPYPLYL